MSTTVPAAAGEVRAEARRDAAPERVEPLLQGGATVGGVQRGHLREGGDRHQLAG